MVKNIAVTVNICAAAFRRKKMLSFIIQIHVMEIFNSYLFVKKGNFNSDGRLKR